MIWLGMQTALKYLLVGLALLAACSFVLTWPYSLMVLFLLFCQLVGPCLPG